MLDLTKKYVVSIQSLSLDDVKNMLLKEKYESIIGHEATAQLLTSLINIPIQFNRKSITLHDGDRLIVLQLMSRLPEGKVLTYEEIKNIKYTFVLVLVHVVY